MNPFTDPRRAKSEEHALAAERSWAAGDVTKSADLFTKAATLEEEVAREVPLGMARVRSVLAISAVSLWHKAGNYAKSKRLAYEFLAGGGVTDQGMRDLEELVEQSSRELELAKLTNDPGMVPIDIKLDGGRVGTGVAPASSARTRRDTVITMLMRCADLEAKLAYRERGPSELDRTDQIQIFEARGIAASYGLRFYVATGTQQPIAGTATVTPSQVAQKFLAVAVAAASGEDAMEAVVPDAHYAQSFLAGFSEVAPDGEDVGSVVCFSPSWKLSNAPRQTFSADHRQALRVAAAHRSSRTRDPKKGERVIEGLLQGVHLTLDESWLEIAVEDNDEPTIVMVTDRRLHSRVAGLFTRGQQVRALGKWSQKAQRLVLTDIVPTRTARESRSGD